MHVRSPNNHKYRAEVTAATNAAADATATLYGIGSEQYVIHFRVARSFGIDGHTLTARMLSAVRSSSHFVDAQL